MEKRIRLELQSTLKRFLPADHESYSIGSGLKVRDILHKFYYDQTKRRPMILPVMVKV